MEKNIKLVRGYAIDQDVDVAVNSANNGLLLGGSGAGRIKSLTGYLLRGSSGEQEYYALCNSLGNIGSNCLNWLKYDRSKEEDIMPSKVELECLRIISSNEGRPVDLGSVHLTSSGNLEKITGYPHAIIHAVGMGYEWRSPETKGNRILANINSITNAYANSFRLAEYLGVKRIALPLMCTRPGYSEVGIEKTYQIFLEQLDKKKDSFDEVRLCLDNECSGEVLGGNVQ